MIQPEIFIESLRQKSSSRMHFNNCIPDKRIYNHYALELFRNLTQEEVDNLYTNMRKTIEIRGKKCGGAHVFALIPEYTLHVLSMDNDKPVCKQDEQLNWRNCYLRLGQDLLTTAHLAYRSTVKNRDTHYFGWSAIIGTDDRRLSEILDKGLAENHFHLNGSTRNFDLSWICMMNHPRHINNFFAEKKDSAKEPLLNNFFEENLNSGISLGTSDNRMSWKHRLLIASWLRITLFLWIQTGTFPYHGNSISHLIKTVEQVKYTSSRKFANYVDPAKLLYGRAGWVMQSNKRFSCIDYAITADVACNDSHCRALIGERALMYKAFKIIYSGKSNTNNWHGFMDFFYLYLLIKNQFRCELIQVNGRYGFKNFAKYQDRKDILFEHFPKYNMEAKNLSVNDSIKNNHVDSLEMRITPKNTYKENRDKIRTIDDAILFLQNPKISKKTRFRLSQERDINFFYTLHFPKKNDDYSLTKEKTPYFFNNPRNYNVRKQSQTQALSIAKALKKYNWLCSRIRGIDACNVEIPCRPEVFAVEFRFLRNFVCTNSVRSKDYNNMNLQPKLCATYHVGEDFIDIIDGLRAIDEAISFLEMKSGERLGHAMALGVNARKYYDLKNHWIVIKKQDYLDNIIWAINKSKALNINLGSAFKQKLYDKASGLIYELYGNDFSIREYYNSWLLRSDDPSLYRFGYFDEKQYEANCCLGINSIKSQYSEFQIAHHHHPERFKTIRNDKKSSLLYSMYHFNPQVRKKGEECEEMHITEDYIKMAENLQIGIQQEISQLRIGIECNPSSNVLIGPFELYEQHPIFNFYPVTRGSGQIHQFVSINTDDQGVFDTSLEEEYALIECTLRKMKNSDQNPMYNDEEIYGYIERLQKNGFSQVFPQAGPNKIV